MPSLPGQSEGGTDKEIMPSVRCVMRYCTCTYDEALELPSDVFLLCKKNMIVEDLQKTPEGRKYLDDCERMAKTEPDIEALKQKGLEYRSVKE